MKSKLLLIIALQLLISVVNGQVKEAAIAVQMKNGSFAELADHIRRETKLGVYYRSEWVEDVNVNVEFDSEETTAILKRVLRGKGLYVDYVPGRGFYILPESVLNKKLSATLSEHLFGSDEENEDYIGGKGGEFLTGTRPEQIMRTIVVGEKGKSTGRSGARVSGRIIDMESGDPVAGATMIILETGKGAVADENGIVIMPVQPGNYTMQVNFIGKEQVNCKLEVNSDGRFVLEMSSSMIAIDEVQIMADQYRDINSTDVGVMRLSMKSLGQMPVFMGEKDVIKISRMLPGITSAGEASSGVNVRGGNVDQNVFYVNRMPVYNTSHLFGFFSAFNSDIIRDFSIYKGNVPATYGGRLSSVFNISTRQGNNRRFTAHAGVSPVSGHMTVEGPLKTETASFILSGRSSYSDWILNRMEDPMLRESDAGFYDFAGSLNVEINEKNHISGFYYQSFDKFSYSDLSDYNYKNQGGVLNWKHQISPALTSDFSATVSNYGFGHIEKNEVSRAYEHNYLLNHNELVSSFRWVPGMKHKVEFGTNLILYRLDRGTIAPYGSTSLREEVELGREQGLEGGVFLSDNYQVNSWLSIYAGLRYSYYTALGPATVQLYEEGYPVEAQNVVGTREFGAFKSIVSHSGPEFRSALNMKAGSNTSFKLAFNQMRQYLLMLSNTVTISPTDQWKLTDYHITPPVSYQYSGGIYHIIPRLGLSGSVELYYKHSEHIVDYKDGADFVNSPFIETEILQGKQQAYGAEFMLERTSGRLNGWISYTWSRSFMHVQGPTDFESINKGNPYPSNYDRPHVLNVIANYKVNRRFTLASNVVYMSGRPVTYPSSLYFIDDIAYIDYYARNQFRVPDYFRIDFSLTIEGNLRAKKLFHSTWNLNVYNVLGRNNPQSLFFKPNENFILGYSFSVIGTPVFTLSWNVKLGNYESN